MFTVVYAAFIRNRLFSIPSSFYIHVYHSLILFYHLKARDLVQKTHGRKLE